MCCSARVPECGVWECNGVVSQPVHLFYSKTCLPRNRVQRGRKGEGYFGRGGREGGREGEKDRDAAVHQTGAVIKATSNGLVDGDVPLHGRGFSGLVQREWGQRAAADPGR